MAAKSWTLADIDREIFEPEASFGAEQLGIKTGRVRKRTLHGGLREGVDVVDVDNGAFSFTLLPTRGMGVWKAQHGDTEIGWKSPIRGPVHPGFVPLAEPSGFGWLDGFDELMCRCGIESNGAPDFDDKGQLKYGLHGRIANRPAHKLTVAGDPTTHEIVVTGVVDESRFHFQKLRMTSTVRTRAGELGYRIADEVTNLSAMPAQCQMLYHVNIGQPILDAGSRLVLPAKIVAPSNARAAEGIKTWDVYAAAEAGYTEQCYFAQMAAGTDGLTQVLLKNAAGTRGVSLHYKIEQLPWFTVWKNTVGGPDGCVTGIEPATNFPNRRTFETEQGRVRTIGPGETARFELGFEWHPDAAGVQKAESAVTRLRGNSSPEIHDTPRSGWSPA